MLNFLGPLIGLGKTWLDGKQKKAQVKAEAEAEVMKNASKSLQDWEQLHAKGSQNSWKDEFWTVVLSIPAILAFIPGMDEHVKNGFEALHDTPEWYRYTLVTVILASFGIRNRHNIGGGIASLFSKPKKEEGEGNARKTQKKQVRNGRKETQVNP